MALKKSELYSSLWQGCDALRGGMDPSQYKDYVLVLLFLKYISDKYAGQPYAPIKIPPGATFQDMVALKGKSTIGDDINKKILGPLANANQQLSQSDFPDFNDPVKLGSGKEMVERLSDLIAIFENPGLNFSKNRADGDDILGDAYEYLMRHFATDSGKSKGQFYTPAEVSRVIAQIVGIRRAKTSASTTVYDPTCGSGSLLLKVADEAGTPVTLYGQEKDAATSGLARMNMILHGNPTASIVQGNSLTDPKFPDGEALKTFDYVVANPPFSDKRWSTGLDPLHDRFERFKAFGVPPPKQGDYAYLLHIVRSLKNTGQGACILPHGVLFRGNAEADIRRALVRKGYIKGIIGLPANLFYGTSIPACIVVLDKAGARAREGIFLIDASGGFLKDGPKNRLRQMDIHRIVDVFIKQLEVPGYARMVPFAEIEKHQFNLNLPRYIDSQAPEDLQDIEGHLRGGIPAADVDALERYWAVCPELRHALFKKRRPGYFDLAVEKSALKPAIYEHPEFASFIAGMNAHFTAWRRKCAASLRELGAGCHPKEVIAELAEGLLAHYAGKPLIDPYDVYQHLMDYWAETMQDDCHLIVADGWKAETARIVEKGKKGKEKDKGWTCDLIPKALLVARYFAKEQAAIEQLATELEGVTARLTEMEEEHGGEDGALADLDKVNKANVDARLKEIQGDKDAKEEATALKDWLKLNGEEADLKKGLKEAEVALDAQAYARYPKLTGAEIKTLVVDDKWLAALDAAIHAEMDRVSRQLTQRVKDLADRYEMPVPEVSSRVAEREAKVNRHLERMGFSWSGAMQDLLTGRKRLPGFSGEWQLKPLGDLAKIQRGASPRPIDNPIWFDDDSSIGWVRISDVTSSGIYLHTTTQRLSPLGVRNSRPVARGSLIMSICATVGRPVITQIDVCIHDGFVVFDNLRVVQQYLYYALKSIEGEWSRYGQTGSQMNLNTGLINRTEISVPPTAEEQTAIAAILSDMDTEITALEAKLAKARQLQQGMMQELLTGRTRLV